jgi:CPA1 family monovalent cation:H+ antiporter
MPLTSVDQMSEQSPLFSGLSKRERKAVMRLLTTVAVPRGRVLAQAGERGREAMVIVSGTARVERDGTAIASLGPGELFGELSLLTGARRMADVTAETDMVVAALSRQEFATLLDTSPQVAQKVLVGALQRLQENAA